MPDESSVILDIRNLTKIFDLGAGKRLKACDSVSLQLHRGETLGIVGESGCGKSTLVRTILQLYRADSGEVFYYGEKGEKKDLLKSKGEELRQDRRKIQMVFQDSALAFDPKMTIQDILCEPLRNFGLLKRGEAATKAAELLRMTELPEDFLCRYPHTMSGGQRQRADIARALALDPEIVIFDEATSALDVSVQKSVCELLLKLQKEKRLSCLFICHDLALVDLMCRSVAVMYIGNVVEVLEGNRISEKGRHPYTRALLNVTFKLDFRPGEKLNILAGDIPSPADLPVGCPFQSRCPQCMDRCRREKPLLKELEPGCKVACHLF